MQDLSNGLVSHRSVGFERDAFRNEDGSYTLGSRVDTSYVKVYETVPRTIHPSSFRKRRKTLRNVGDSQRIRFQIDPRTRRLSILQSFPLVPRIQKKREKKKKELRIEKVLQGLVSRSTNGAYVDHVFPHRLGRNQSSFSQSHTKEERTNSPHACYRGRRRGNVLVIDVFSEIKKKRRERETETCVCARTRAPIPIPFPEALLPDSLDRGIVLFLFFGKEVVIRVGKDKIWKEGWWSFLQAC